MTIVHLSDVTLVLPSLDTQSFTCPMSLDTLAHSVDITDPARVILFLRHPVMPQNIRGVTRCGI